LLIIQIEGQKRVGQRKKNMLEGAASDLDVGGAQQTVIISCQIDRQHVVACPSAVNVFSFSSRPSEY
jgi:hypothetical protein